MAGIAVKKSGAWQQVPNGKVYLKEGGYGGGYWLRPGKIYKKIGAYGGPRWELTSYRGYPAAPTNLRVTWWGYNSQIAVAWDQPASTVAVQQYHIEVCDQNGTPFWGWHTSPTNFTTPSGYNLANDTKYIIRVRSLSYEGLYSDYNVYSPWNAPGWATLRVWIGHPAVYQDVLV